MAGTRKTIPRISAPSNISRTTNIPTSSRTQIPSNISRIPVPPPRTAHEQSRLPASNTQVRASSIPVPPSRTPGLPSRPTTTQSRVAVVVRPVTGATSRTISRPPSVTQRGIYGPKTQVVNVAQRESAAQPASRTASTTRTGTGAIPKTTVKTVKTKKVESIGNRTKTTTTITKSYKPVPQGTSSTAILKAKPGPSRLSPDVSVTEDLQNLEIGRDLITPASSLEKIVENELIDKLTLAPGVSARVKGSRKTETTAPTITTAEGQTIPTTLQINLDRSVERSPEIEYIKRYMTGVEVDDKGVAKKYEYTIQEAEPGPSTSARSDGVTPLHEVISVKSTISFAPGLRQKISTTVYESTEPDPEAVQQLVDEEADEIERISQIPPPEIKGSPSNMYPLKKKLQTMQLNPESVRILEQSVELPPVSADEPPEEMPPEIMAAIMHTEEKGINMESEPSNVYNYLFPNMQDDLLIKVKPVAPAPMQQVVIPEQVPAELLTDGIPAEIESVAQDAKSCCCKLPADDLYSTSILKERPPKVHNLAKKGQPDRKRYPVLAKEQPPWNAKDLQPIMDLVGAAPTSPVQDIPDLADLATRVNPIYYHTEENVLEYHLTPQPPRFTSNVQLRGSQKPSWFPGYYMALPDNIRVVTSPCDVLPAAWRAVQPDIFAEESFLIVG